MPSSNDDLELRNGSNSKSAGFQQNPHHHHQVSILDRNVVIDLEKAAPKTDFTLSQFCTRLQIHGLADWYDAKSLTAKMFWILMMIAFVVILAIGISQSIREYYTNPIKTTVSITPSNSLPFPNIYICPFNYLDISKQSREMDQLKMDYIPDIGTGDLLAGTISAWKDLAIGQMPMDAMGGSGGGHPEMEEKPLEPLTVTTFKKSLLGVSYTPDDVIVGCEFQSRKVGCSNAVRLIVDKEYGACYSVAIKYFQKLAGAGVRLLIDLHTESFDPDKMMPFEGALIRITDKLDPTAIGGFLASPGKYVKVDLDLAYQDLINVDYSETPQRCHSNVEGNFTLINSSYTKSACLSDCALAATFKLCQCITVFDADYIRQDKQNVLICNKTRMTDCVSEQVQWDSLEECYNTCLRPCKSWTYRFQESNMNLRSFEAMPEINSNDHGGFYGGYARDDSSPEGWVSPGDRLNGELFTTSAPEFQNSADLLGPVSTEDSDSSGLLGPASAEDTSTVSVEQTTTSVVDAAVITESSTTAGEITTTSVETTSEDAQTSEVTERPAESNPSYWKRSMILLDVSFSSMEYTSVIQNRAETKIELISDLGGQTGLWLGASMLTLIQLVALIFACCYTRYFKWKQNKVHGTEA